MLLASGGALQAESMKYYQEAVEWGISDPQGGLIGNLAENDWQDFFNLSIVEFLLINQFGFDVLDLLSFSFAEKRESLLMLLGSEFGLNQKTDDQEERQELLDINWQLIKRDLDPFMRAKLQIVLNRAEELIGYWKDLYTRTRGLPDDCRQLLNDKNGLIRAKYDLIDKLAEFNFDNLRAREHTAQKNIVDLQKEISELKGREIAQQNAKLEMSPYLRSDISLRRGAHEA